MKPLLYITTGYVLAAFLVYLLTGNGLPAWVVWLS
jgi:hypothetical protein